MDNLFKLSLREGVTPDPDAVRWLQECEDLMNKKILAEATANEVEKLPIGFTVRMVLPFPGEPDFALVWGSENVSERVVGPKVGRLAWYKVRFKKLDEIVIAQFKELNPFRPRDCS